MFQPQPTPFASCFAPSPFLFPAAPNTTAAPGASTSRSYSSTTTSAVSNPSPISISDPSFDLPPQPSLSPYGLAPSETPFGFYFPPADPSGRVGAGARIGGAGGAGATSQQGSSRGRPAAVAQAAPPTTASTRLRSGATAVAASPNPSARGLICGSSLAASSQLTSSANLSGRHQQQQQQQQQQQHRRSRHRHNPAASRMEDQDPHGMAAQQAAAKDYQPDLPVRLSPSIAILTSQEPNRWMTDAVAVGVSDDCADDDAAAELLGGQQGAKRRHHRRICQSRPDLRREDNCSFTPRLSGLRNSVGMVEIPLFDQ